MREHETMVIFKLLIRTSKCPQKINYNICHTWCHTCPHRENDWCETWTLL